MIAIASGAIRVVYGGYCCCTGVFCLFVFGLWSLAKHWHSLECHCRFPWPLRQGADTGKATRAREAVRLALSRAAVKGAPGWTARQGAAARPRPVEAAIATLVALAARAGGQGDAKQGKPGAWPQARGVRARRSAAETSGTTERTTKPSSEAQRSGGEERGAHGWTAATRSRSTTAPETLMLGCWGSEQAESDGTHAGMTLRKS